MGKKKDDHSDDDLLHEAIKSILKIYFDNFAPDQIIMHRHAEKLNLNMLYEAINIWDDLLLFLLRQKGMKMSHLKQIELDINTLDLTNHHTKLIRNVILTYNNKHIHYSLSIYNQQTFYSCEELSKGKNSATCDFPLQIHFRSKDKIFCIPRCWYNDYLEEREILQDKIRHFINQIGINNA